MQVRVLGELEVVVDGRTADLGGPKPRALVALLVAAEGRPVPLEQLVDQIWGDDPPARVEASLQSYVARLRRALEPGREVRAAAGRLRTHAGGYSLSLADADVDVRRFTDLLREAAACREPDPGTAERHLAEALALWRGDPYPGLTASPALAAEATRLLELRSTALEEMWALRIDRGDLSAAVAEVERLVLQQPLRERLWALLALAQYRAARQGDALDTMRRAREHLAEELGIDPGEELRQLEVAILQQDPALALPLRPAPEVGTETVRPAGTPPAAPPAQATGPTLVGREDALREADAALASAAAGGGRTVLVTGEAGIGKTRFTEALLRRGRELGFRTGRGTWDPDGAPPLWGWRRAVSEALGREGTLSPSGAVVDAVTQSFRLAESLVNELRDGPPTLLVLDDVHWADTDSLQLVRRFASELRDVPVVLVVALRSGTADGGGPVADLLAAMARLDPLRLELGGLDPEALVDFVRQGSGVEVSTETATALADRTGGNPFFVTELVRLLAAEGALTRAAAPAWRTVPRGVRDVVRQRIGQLSGPTSRVLDVAAVVGRRFELSVLVRASDEDPDAVSDAVESALVLGLVEERGPDSYRFTHALVRDAIYEALAAPTRARTHARVATAVEQHHAGRVAENAAELAEHYRLAGPAHARSAWTFARLAAESAAARSAHHEAWRLLDRARELQLLDTFVTAEEREGVLVALGRALRRSGRPLDAWGPLAEAGASALARGDAVTAAECLLEVSEGAIWGWRVRDTVNEDAITLWRAVLAALPPDAPEVVRARVEAALAVEFIYRPGDFSETLRLADTAIARIRRAEAAPAQVLEVLQVAGLTLVRPELLDRREAVLDELVEMTGRIGDEAGLALALTKRSAVRAERGRLEEAHSDLVRAHHLAERLGLPQLLLIAGWALNLLRQARGELAEAEAAVADLEALEHTLAMPGVGIAVAHRTTIRQMQGRLAEMEPALAIAARFQPDPMKDLHALSLVAAGRKDEARRLLGPWPEQPELLRDYLWVSLTVVRAWLWCDLGDAEAVRDLRRQLEPYADRFAVGGMSALFLGSVSHTLGMLALAADEPEAARDHLQHALTVHRGLGLDHWSAQTEQLLAAVSAPAS